MDFSWDTHDDLLNLAFDRTQLAKLDRGDTMNLIKELAIRLQRASDQLQRLER